MNEIVEAPPRVATDTPTLPAARPAGTTVSSCVVVADSTSAAVVPNFTTFICACASKFCPRIVTAVPTGPSVGVTADIAGADTVVNSKLTASSAFPEVSVMSAVSVNT